ncbi:lytic transglycosylase domain-containing protein [Pseudoroseomonas globiformis]|uniref:Lytic transglycosylase domain-containing protein n=1 Tax=Teichococcus globiformis TaxID=2307229 RepID=A0ABV7FZ12_9PROT
MRPVTAQSGALIEEAMSVPRPSRHGIAGLPQPLAASDAARLSRIFALQRQGDFDAAEVEARRLDDRRLIGHVQADRWRRAPTPPSTPELHDWLTRHSDLPDAGAIHAMLSQRLPRNVPQPPVPTDDSLPADIDMAPEDRAPASASRDAVSRTEVAQTAFHQGRDEEAYRIAADVAKRNPTLAHPAYVAGLAAWGMGWQDRALTQFEAAARAENAAPALRAAAAFWTARAAIRTRRPQLYVPWMLQAAQEPRSFYGMIARRVLGLSPGFAWERDVAGAAESAALAETAAGWRALALLQIGERERAEQELRRLWPIAKGNPALLRAVLAVASQAGLTDLASQVAGLVQSADGRPRDFDRYPLPHLEPMSGFRVDPALLYGLALQESRFDPKAVSPAGARGLMQIMPATAAYIVGDPSLNGAGIRRLHDPGFSLELAQRYLHHLTAREVVDGDLIRLLAAYNNGPGNVGRWAPNVRHQDDPFLFIESIPVGETRGFVQRVLTYSWIYASRLGLPSPSLDALAQGEFPRFGSAPLELAEQPPLRGRPTRAAAR